MGRPSIDLKGQRFGKLIVIEKSESTKSGVTWRCVCECGNEKIVRSGHLIGKMVTSCGCSWRSAGGESLNKDRQIWFDMVRRCHDPNAKDYETYGAVGIKVCEHLRKRFENMIALIGSRPDDKLSVDRHPDGEGNYSCGSCDECIENGWGFNIRWATSSQQRRNQSRNPQITIGDKTMTPIEWAEFAGLKPKTFLMRWRRGDTGYRLLRPPGDP